MQQLHTAKSFSFEVTTVLLRMKHPRAGMGSFAVRVFMKDDLAGRYYGKIHY